MSYHSDPLLWAAPELSPSPPVVEDDNNAASEDDVILPVIRELPPDEGIRMPAADRGRLPLSKGEDEDESGRGFHSIRPWIGNVQPPDDFDPETLSCAIPDVTLQLDYVYGYRSRQAHNNLFWVEEPNVILYHSAAVGVVCDVVTRTQRHYFGHTDDILCLDYNANKRVVATGGLGKNNTAPINIWNVDDLSTRIVIKGTLMYGILAVALSRDASRVFAVGMDTNHTVGLFETATGLLLSTVSGDKNRITHAIIDTTAGRDHRRNFITVGVSHIKFWQKVKGDAPMVGKKAIGGDIASQTMVSAACTLQHVVVGNVSGTMYVFTDAVLVRSVKAHTAHLGGLYGLHNTVYSGGRDGKLHRWNLELPDAKLEATIDMDPLSYMSSGELLIEGKKKRRHNGARSINVVNGNILVGTAFGSIYVVPEEPGAPPTTVLESHFEDTPASMPELWGLDTHPTEPLFCSSGDDATLRLWSLELGSMILMTNVTFKSRACGFSHDGSMIAVGHENGCFSVWDAMMLTPIVPFTRRREHRVQAIKFSPDGRFLAMSMDTAHVIDIYYVKRDFEYIGYCDGFSSNFKHLDWNARGTVLQGSTTDYEIVRFNVPECAINQATELCNENWTSHSCTIGWGVQGIWEGCNDGTDINCCAKSKNEMLLASGYDSSEVRLYRYPCIPRQISTSAKPVYPDGRTYTGHSSHVTNIKWSADDRYVISCGGMDLTVLRWKVVPVGPRHPPKEPTASQTAAESVASGTIRELSRSLKRSVFVAEQGDDGPVDDAPERPPQEMAESQNAASHLGGSRRSGSSHGRPASTLRRPFSSNADVKSRFLDQTASMQSKQREGRAQREHIMKQQAARKRFSQF